MTPPGTLGLWTRQLNRDAGFRITGAYADAESALPCLLAQPPMLLLADWQLPGEDGLQLIAGLKAVHPGVCAVLITNHDLAELPTAALRAGVNGCLLKSDSPAALPARLRAVMDGTCIFSARILTRLATQLPAAPSPSADAHLALTRLTVRERDVLREFSHGLLTKEVADRLGISETTVKSHKENLVANLGVKNITEAVAKCAGFDC